MQKSSVLWSIYHSFHILTNYEPSKSVGLYNKCLDLIMYGPNKRMNLINEWTHFVLNRRSKLSYYQHNLLPNKLSLVLLVDEENRNSTEKDVESFLQPTIGWCGLIYSSYRPGILYSYCMHLTCITEERYSVPMIVNKLSTATHVWGILAMCQHIIYAERAQ